MSVPYEKTSLISSIPRCWEEEKASGAMKRSVPATMVPTARPCRSRARPKSVRTPTCCIVHV